MFVAGFSWADQDDNVLIVRSMNKCASFSMADLGIDLYTEMSTAGYRWYQNAIGYVTTLVSDDGSPSRLVFYFRHRSGKDTTIDMQTLQPIELSAFHRTALNKRTVTDAGILLQSKVDRDRLTGVIHLGQLGAEEYLPRLQGLLNDPATYLRITQDSRESVYYIREAAELAIRLIREHQSANKELELPEGQAETIDSAIESRLRKILQENSTSENDSQ